MLIINFVVCCLLFVVCCSLFVVCHFDKLSKSDADFDGTRILDGTPIRRIGAVFKWNADDADFGDLRRFIFWIFLSAVIFYICVICVLFFWHTYENR